MRDARRTRFLRAAAVFFALAWKLATIVRASQPIRQPVSKILTAKRSHVVDNNSAKTTKIDVTIVLFMNTHICYLKHRQICLYQDVLLQPHDLQFLLHRTLFCSGQAQQLLEGLCTPKALAMRTPCTARRQCLFPTSHRYISLTFTSSVVMKFLHLEFCLSMFAEAAADMPPFFFLNSYFRLSCLCIHLSRFSSLLTFEYLLLYIRKIHQINFNYILFS